MDLFIALPRNTAGRADWKSNLLIDSARFGFLCPLLTGRFNFCHKQCAVALAKIFGCTAQLLFSAALDQVDGRLGNDALGATAGVCSNSRSPSKRIDIECDSGGGGR